MFGNTNAILKEIMDSQRLGEFPFLQSKSNFPLVNVSVVKTDEKGNGSYFIEYALAGYSREDITLEEDSTFYAGHNFNVIKLTAKTSHSDTVEYTRKNIAYRDIEHSMLISPQDHIKDANYKDGILKVFIERVIDEPKGRTINIM